MSVAGPAHPRWWEATKITACVLVAVIGSAGMLWITPLGILELVVIVTVLGVLEIAFQYTGSEDAYSRSERVAAVGLSVTVVGFGGVLTILSTPRSVALLVGVTVVVFGLVYARTTPAEVSQ